MACRSLLFVPAKEKMLAKVGNLSADAYIIDLEDSIEDSDKQNALERVEAFLQQKSSEVKIFVRVNSEHIKRELEALQNYEEIGFMIPKYEYNEAYAAYENILKKHSVIALVETSMGVVNIQEIAKCDWVNAIAFGAEDYTAETNMVNKVELLTYQKSRLLTFAKAYHKEVYDTPSFQLENRELFEKEVCLAVDMGFDGKLAINPKHLEFINKSFATHDLDMMKRIIETYHAAGEPVVVIDGIVYEKMHIRRMEKIVKENGGS